MLEQRTPAVWQSIDRVECNQCGRPIDRGWPLPLLCETMTALSTASDLAADDYIVIGLATCFIKDEDGVHSVQIAEPIPSAALEAIVKGIPTSYEVACATTIGAVLPNDQPHLPADFPPATQFCDEFAFRLFAAARTYKSRPSAQTHIPVGTARRDWNFSLDRKRVLNSERLVRTEDNVKQHAHTHKVL